MLLCSNCGDTARVRFSRSHQNRWARTDLCTDCAENHLRLINQGPPRVVRVEDLTDETIAEHADIDARAARRDARSELQLLRFGSW